MIFTVFTFSGPILGIIGYTTDVALLFWVGVILSGINLLMFWSPDQKKEARRAAARLVQIRKFVDTVDGVEVFVAKGYAALLTKFIRLAQEEIPHAPDDASAIYLLSPKLLRRESKKLEEQFILNMKKSDYKYLVLGMCQEMLSLFLISQAWNIDIPASPRDPDYFSSPNFVKVEIASYHDHLIAEIPQLAL